MKALILAAGEGLRCRPLTLTRSMVMLPVANRPILEYIIRSLEQNDLREIILVVGYKKERIMDYFRNGKDFGVNISYIEQEAQLGTAHAIKLAEPMVNEMFLGKIEERKAGSIEKGAVIIGDVAIGDNSVIRSGSYIVGPVIIGKNCNIGPNTTILPSTSVGDNCTINSFTEIENSIIMNDTRIGTGSYISNSIICLLYTSDAADDLLC